MMEELLNILSSFERAKFVLSHVYMDSLKEWADDKGFIVKEMNRTNYMNGGVMADSRYGVKKREVLIMNYKPDLMLF